MKRTGMVLVAMLMAGGLARAGTLEGMAEWARNEGREAVTARLARQGVAEANDVAAILDGWDEAVVVERALAGRAYALLAWVGRYDTFSPASVASIRQALLAEPEPVPEVLDLIRYLPLGMRGDFEQMLYDLVPRRFAATPAFGRHYVKYALLRNEGLFSAAMDPSDLVGLLLAPEPLALGGAESLRRALRDGAVVQARNWLRYSGRSFVVRDGVNPLTEAVQPVVEALNAPGAAGLEAALRGLGAEVPDFDRGELEALAVDWQAKIMSGELIGAGLNSVLGKLSVVLGVEGFNAFVERYNYGNGGTGR